MNVSTTTLPRRSVNDTRRSSCAVSVKGAAGPIVGRASRDGAAAAGPAARAATAASRRARRIPLALQLLPELAEEPPVRAVGDDLLRRGLDEAGLVQAQGVEADGVLGVVLPPLAVRDLLHRL